MVEADAGAIEGVLGGAGHPGDVPDGRDGDRSVDPVGADGGGDPVRDPEHIDVAGDVAVLQVPPDGDLDGLALLRSVVPRLRRRGGMGWRRSGSREVPGPPVLPLIAGAGLEEEDVSTEGIKRARGEEEE